jgi:hypothetical protein
MKKLILCLLGITYFHAALAQVASESATGVVEYRGVLGADERKAAIEDAQLSALDTFIARLAQPALSQIYEQNKADIHAQKDRFILNYVQLSDNQDKKARTYSVTLRTEINQASLTNFLTENYAVNEVPKSQKSPISFVFVSRELASTLNYDDTVTANVTVDGTSSDRTESRVVAQQTQSMSDSGASVKESSIDQEANQSRAEVNTSTSGQSLTRASDNTYRVRSSLEFNTAVTSVLSGSGYEVVEAEFIEGLSNGLLNLEQVRSEFSTGTDLQSSTLLNMAQAFRGLEIPYFAMGTLDAGTAERDAVSGAIRVNVSVTGKIYDFTGRFPTTVSSVGPIVFSGQGSDQMMATNNALKAAAESLGNTISQELSVREVQ